MWDWLKERRAAVGFLILALGMMVALATNGVLVNRINSKDNATRCAVVAMIVQLTANSERNAQATVSSHTASAAQKAAARHNLSAIQAATRTTEDALGHPHGQSCLSP